MSTRRNRKKDIARFIFLLAVIVIFNKTFHWFVSLAIVFLFYFVLIFLINFLNLKNSEH